MLWESLKFVLWIPAYFLGSLLLTLAFYEISTAIQRLRKAFRRPTTRHPYNRPVTKL